MATNNYVSYNVRGLRDNKKRRKLFLYFQNHKYDFILLQETHSTVIDIITWKKEWGGDIYFSHGSRHSKGVMILTKPSTNDVVNSVVEDPNGRYVILNMNVNGTGIELINVYGYNVDRDDLFTEIANYLNNNDWDSVIWGGDFNLIFNLELDKTGGLPHTHFSARSKLLDLMQTFDLVDIWRDRNPKSKHFTWHSGVDNAIHCRLDFFIVSSHLKHSITSVDILSLFGSDHSSVTLKLRNGISRGKGMWKLNTSLLDDPLYIDLVNDTISNTIDSFHGDNPSTLWEVCKVNIRSASISYSKSLAIQRKNDERNLIKKISSLEQLNAVSPSDLCKIQLLEARAALNYLYDYKLKGIIIRSRAQWSEEGEKNTKYFLNLEKRNKTLNKINELVLENKTVINTSEEIMHELKNFYQNLYTKQNNVNSDNFYDTLNVNCNKLSEEQSSHCEGLLSLDECRQSVFSMSLNKSPGSDGFPVEFYRKFWDDVGILVLNSFNYAFQTGYISDEQGRACITLIPKPSKDVKSLKNWRPIALLNTDYKLVAKCLANRMKFVLTDIISPEQTGFLKGRFIGENVRLILDLINYCDNKHIPGALLFIDFEKAFDFLDWNFIQNTLSHFNFGREFRTWINTLYNNTSSCVLNNGFFTSYFRVSRGVRQGCPLSPYLFITCTEILNILINLNSNIRGITITGTTLKISNYADDTVIITDGRNDSFKGVMAVLDNFADVSGLKVNVTKSNLFPLGPLYVDPPWYFKDFEFKISDKPITYLGVTFNHHEEDFFKLNYTPKLSRIKNLLNIWSSRDLTPIGKILIIKTFGISQLVYLLTVLPNPPPNYFQELNRLFYNFIWSGKPDKVKRSVLVNAKCNGGLNMIDLSLFAKSLKCKWVKLYLDDSPGAWKVLFDKALGKYGGSFFY